MAVKLVCLNLWQGGNLFDEILTFLDKEDADIVALQEVYNGKEPHLAPKYRSIDALQERLHYPYSDFAPAFLDNRQEGRIVQGNAVLSRFPISYRDVTFFNEPYREDYVEIPENFPICPRNLQHVVLDSPSGDINLYNFQGVWDMAGDRYSESRQKMSEVIVQATAGKSRVIVAGDTNATPGNQAIKNIEQHLHNIFEGELITTFNMRRKDNPGYATAVVDMIFISPDLQVLSHRCPDIDVSDHLPLVVELAIA